MKLALIANPDLDYATIGKWTDASAGKIKGHQVISLPGLRSLSRIDCTTEAEIEAINFLESGDYDTVLNIIDASNLERSLYLTVQLIEMQIPLIIILTTPNKDKTTYINVEKFIEITGVPTIQINSKDKQGKNELFAFVTGFNPAKPNPIEYPPPIDQAIQAIQNTLKHKPNPAWEAIKALETDESNNAEILQQKKYLEQIYHEDTDLILMNYRYEFIARIIKSVVSKGSPAHKSISDRIDSIILGKYSSIPFFLLCMYLIFATSITLGGFFQDNIASYGNWFVDTILFHLLHKFGLPNIATHIICHGIAKGVVMVISFLPVIATSYFCMLVIQESGYMARVAFIVEKLFRKFNLSGKAFIPLFMGFGCNVPAIMSTRILENEKDRIATIMMVPFMSCSARLVVYTLFGVVFFESNAVNIIFILYLIGIIVAVITGIIIKKFILHGTPTNFVIELPLYNFPSIKSILGTTVSRLKDFALGAGKIIIITFMVLEIMSSFNSQGSLNLKNSEDSLLADIGKSFTHILTPMGVSEDNWLAPVSIIAGAIAKEVVAATYGTTYNHNDDMEHNPEAKDRLLTLFDGKIGAFAYMLFILLYFPCISVFATISKEIGIKWAIASATWSTLFAYVIAVVFYQTAILVFR